MKRVFIFLRMDSARIIALGLLIAAFFTLNNLERFGGWKNWTPPGWLAVGLGSLVLVAFVRSAWFFLLEHRTEDMTADYSKFVERTKVRKWF